MYDKILYISTSLIPSERANAIHVMKMCEALARKHSDVELVAATTADPAGYKEYYKIYDVDHVFNIKLIRIPDICGKFILYKLKVFSYLSKNRSMKTLVYTRSVSAAFFSLFLGFKTIYESHSAPNTILASIAEAYALRSRRLLRLIVISSALKSIYEKRYPFLKNIYVFHDAASIPKNNQNVEYKWPSTRRTLQIGYVGNLYRGRGVEIILECARKLPTYDFHIVGGGRFDIAAFKGRVAQNVFFHGYVPYFLTAFIRSKCDMLLMPYQEVVEIPNSKINTSRWMSPLKLFEYMASGKAIISSDLPAIREVLNEKNAALVPSTSVEKWKDKIEELRDGEARARLGRNAYNDFIAFYTWEMRVAGILKGIT